MDSRDRRQQHIFKITSMQEMTKVLGMDAFFPYPDDHVVWPVLHAEFGTTKKIFAT